jgi:hypothetical protein
MRLQSASFHSLGVVLIAYICSLLIGCAGVISESAPSVEESRFIQQIAELKSGMGRDQVHSIMGHPYVSSEHLKFEIFQSIGEFTEYIGVPPIPIPWLGYLTQDYIPVLLVVYYDDWTVKDYEWDLYRESETYDKKNVLIELEGYTLVRTDPKLAGMMLFAPSEVSEKVLLEPLLGNVCVLYLVMPDQPIAREDTQLNPGLTKLFLNEKLFLNMNGFPYSSRGIQNYWVGIISDTVFIGFQLPEGLHELEIRGNSNVVKEDTIKGSFTCVAGQVNFAHIRAEMIDVWSEQGWRLGYRYGIKGEIYISKSWPKEIKDRRQILMYRDIWYGLEHQK